MVVIKDCAIGLSVRSPLCDIGVGSLIIVRQYSEYKLHAPFLFFNLLEVRSL